MHVNDLSPVELSRLIQRRLFGPRRMSVSGGEIDIVINECERLTIPCPSFEIDEVRRILADWGWHDMGDLFEHEIAGVHCVLGTVLYASPTRGF
ncbi:hypothetical protein WU87_03190 [Corynebacterium minutissimum]|uniref:Uncharacterized protein n=1 Tax=Corynebacterium minutissimum TaxID=38301 RepID=A0ACC4UCD5_9CORY|nr:hypothetical protein WU87_03190 [Corynebacterium minutissimum]